MIVAHNLLNRANISNVSQNFLGWGALFPILGTDQSTANIYGQIKYSLQSNGKPTPDNDIWIAAIAK